MSFILPIETCELIIDHLHNDRSALRNCSLTSKHWVPACHYHLFHTIDLSNVPFSVELTFVDLIHARGDSIGIFVRNLSVSHYNRSPEWLRVSLSTFTAHMPNLSKLSVRDTSLTLVHPAYQSLFDGFRSVETLHLAENVDFHGFSRLQELISSFPRLSALDIADSELTFDSDYGTVQLPSPALHTLRLRSSQVQEPFGRWLASSSSIRNLWVTDIDPSPGECLDQVLHDLDSQLQSLTLELDPYSSRPGWLPLVCSVDR